tara:strand:- start:581 stop:1201 length:621 start_codon:yes stop_codon:yes gene_type:complete
MSSQNNYIYYYTIIYDFHKRIGYQQLPDSVRQGMIPKFKAYINLINELPHPNEAKQSCIALVFRQVRKGIMTWICWEKNLNSKFLFTYAEEGIKSLADSNQWVDKRIVSPDFFDLCEKSPLFTKFGNDSNIAKHYKERKEKKNCNICYKQPTTSHIFSLVNHEIVKSFVCYDCGEIELKKSNTYWGQDSMKLIPTNFNDYIKSISK